MTMQYKHTELHKQGQPYTLRLWEPVTPAPKGGHPLLFMLDGDWIHAHLLQFLQRQPRALNYAIACIGFGDIERQLARQRRSYDYTPAPHPPTPKVDPRQPNWPCGGGDDFLQLIQAQALPWLQQQCPINPLRLGLYGHSYGGLFVLYTLLTQPNLFQHYIAASPSLWWYAPYMQELAAQLPPLSKRTRLDLLIGGKEQWRPQPPTPDAPRPAGIPTQRFLDQFLNQLPASTQLAQQLRVYPDAEHGTMLGLSTEFALLEFLA